VDRVRSVEGDEIRSKRREAAAGGERKRAVAEGRRRSGEEVRRRVESSLEVPPMTAEARRRGFCASAPSFHLGTGMGCSGRPRV
jgi:hypothetical protein